MLNSCHVSKTVKPQRHNYLSSDNPMKSLIQASAQCLLAMNPTSNSLVILILLKTLPSVPWLLTSSTSHWKCAGGELLTGKAGTSGPQAWQGWDKRTVIIDGRPCSLLHGPSAIKPEFSKCLTSGPLSWDEKAFPRAEVT